MFNENICIRSELYVFRARADMMAFIKFRTNGVHALERENITGWASVGLNNKAYFRVIHIEGVNFSIVNYIHVYICERD